MSITFAIDVRVYFEDTDFSGRVYHGAYIRFLERGRSELIRAAGLDHRALADQAKPVYFTLRRIDVSFHAPAVIDDLVRVETTPVASGRANFLLDQAIVRGDTRLVTARADLCLIDAAGRPQRPSPQVRAALAPPGTG